MRHLLLLRHAKSSWDDPQQPDHSRTLNARGLHAAQGLRQTLLGLGVTPDVVLVSSARRTLQTLQALGPFATPPLIQPMDALYLASAEAMLQVLRRVTADKRCVLLIGHNPGLHDLAVLLSAHGGTSVAGAGRLLESYPTGGLSQFAVEGAWSEIGPEATRLLGFAVPAERADFSGRAEPG